jgi:hypothetical protein
MEFEETPSYSARKLKEQLYYKICEIADLFK